MPWKKKKYYSYQNKNFIILFSVFIFILDMPDTSMVVIDWIYSCLWRNVQQSLEGAQIYNKTKTRSKGNFFFFFFFLQPTNIMKDMFTSVASYKHTNRMR